jgi:hypothetical protein
VQLDAILTAAAKAGITGTAIVMSMAVLIYILRLILNFIGGYNNTSNKQWEMLLSFSRQQLSVQTKMLLATQKRNEDVDDRFDALEREIKSVSYDLKELIRLIGEDCADG